MAKAKKKAVKKAVVKKAVKKAVKKKVVKRVAKVRIIQRFNKRIKAWVKFRIEKGVGSRILAVKKTDKTKPFKGIPKN